MLTKIFSDLFVRNPNCRQLIFTMLLAFSSTYAVADDFYQKLSNAAISLTEDQVTYDPRYFSIEYPNGDVPRNKGVCTDVVIRAYRKVGIDLQKRVHEDMVKNFSKYPNSWGLKRTDTNIDHRRVPNLQAFFTRYGHKLAVTGNPQDYKTGDIVTWVIQGKLPHIGIVSHVKTQDNRRSMIVHNVGAGQVLEDFLFEYPITGHYRYGQ